MRRGAALATTALLLLGTATPAAAALSDADREAGLWHLEKLRIDELHARGLTGSGVTIAVIDTGINLQAAELQGANITVKGTWCVDSDTGERASAVSTDFARAAHGTAVTAMIVGNGVAEDGGRASRGIAPGAEIWLYDSGSSTDDTGAESCRASQPEESTTDLTIRVTRNWETEGAGEDQYVTDFDWSPDAMAALDAIRGGADIVSVSLGGMNSTGWAAVVAEAIRNDVIVVAGIPNPADFYSSDSGSFAEMAYGTWTIYPAALNGVVAVNALDEDARVIRGPEGHFSSSLNTSIAAPGVDLLAAGDGTAEWNPRISRGTSLATPLVAGTIALALQAHPDAGPHQILQAMARTTTDQDGGEPEWLDMEYGYGVINPRGIVDADPTGFPDENPFFVTDPSDPRCGYGLARVETLEECDTWPTDPLAEDVWPVPTPTESAGDGPGADEDPGADDDPVGAPVPGADEGADGPSLLLLAVMGISAVGFIGLLIGVLVLNGRRKRAQR